MASLNFNAAEVQQYTAFEPVPAGWYDVKIISSELKATKDNTGTRLNFGYEIIGGQFNGRKIFDGLNVKNPNPKAQEIARSQLSSICHAVNVINMQQTEQLHGIPFKVKVKVVPPQNGYEAKNEIQDYKSASHNVTTGAAVAGGAGTTRPAVPTAPAGFGGAAQQPAQAARATQTAPAGFGAGFGGQGQTQEQVPVRDAQQAQEPAVVDQPAAFQPPEGAPW